MVTVAELLGDLGLRPRCGEGAVEVPVRWVHISEHFDPTPWLSGGELLLTTGMQLTSAERQREFVARLSDHRIAGLGFGTGFAHAEIPEPLLQAAREHDLPVFEVPYETPFIAVTEAAFTRLVNEQYAVLRRAIAAHERLEKIVLSQQGLGALAGTLATQLGAAVLVCDARGGVMAHHEFRRPVAPGAVQALRGELAGRRGGAEPARAFLPSHAELVDRSLALPVAAEGSSRAHRAEAWLVAVKDSGPLSDFDRLTLHQAVTIVALELLRERVEGDTERRLAGDVLSGIVAGELSGAELTRRLEPFRLGDTVAAIVVRRGGQSAHAVEAALADGLRGEAVDCLVASTGALTCALVAGSEETELLSVATAAAATLPRDPELRVGLGRGVPAARARRSFHEARCAVEAIAFAEHDADGHHGATSGNGSGNGNGNGNGRTNGNGRRSYSEVGRAHAGDGPPHVATYRDLGSFALLLSLQDQEALRLFCDSILGPIEAGDGHYGGELMRSLEAFIEENGQWERAAKRLYCHRHTLRYRIRRVEELTGRSLSSARDRIEFWLALRGRELVA